MSLSGFHHRQNYLLLTQFLKLCYKKEIEGQQGAFEYAKICVLLTGSKVQDKMSHFLLPFLQLTIRFH
jgi:hypothetical protein